MFRIGNYADPSIFTTLLDLLEKQPVAINNYRNKVGKGRSQCWGIVKQRNSKYAGSRWNCERPDVYRELIKIGRLILPPEFSYQSIQVNDNFRCAEHYDKGNRGESAIIGFGEYSNGNLFVEDTSVDIRHRVVFFDGSTYRHSTEGWDGHRYSLVYHTASRQFTEIPSYTVIESSDHTLTLKEELNGLVRMWKKGVKCISSSDNVIPPKRANKPSLMECLE